MSFEKCPNCGWEEPSRLRKVSQHMNLYAHFKESEDGKITTLAPYGILNHHEDMVTIEPDVEGSVPFKVVKVDPKYTYKPPVEATVKLLNKPVPTAIQKQTTMTTPEEQKWLKEQPKAAITK